MKADLLKKTKNYLYIFPEEKKQLKEFLNLLEIGDDLFDRKNFNGHITTTGLVISPNKKIPLIFHNNLKKYLTPGGHIEKSDKDIVAAALREIEEETSIKKVKMHDWCLKNNCPIIIDSHIIPENKNKNEASHIHHDFMFIFKSEDENILIDKNEISKFKWVDINNINKDKSNISRAVAKIIKLNIL